MIVDGSCHCGAIRYQAEVNPDTTIICQCTDCQTISGAPYRVNVAASTRTLQITGEPKTYAKRGDSGAEVTTAFCGACGTALYSGKGEAPKFVFLRLGAIKQRADLPPKAQGFCASGLTWSMDITGIPQVEPPSRRD